MVKEDKSFLVSIIMAAYNAEKTIAESIESVLNQTYKNFELIVVDDGSVDATGEIVDEYAAKDNRIKVFHNQNQGVSKTRNFGLKQASGDYVQIIDSDDLWAENMLETTVGAIGENDILIFGFKTFPGDEVEAVDECQFNSHEEIMDNLVFLFEKHMVNSSWNKLYSRKLISDNNAEFQSEISLGEDAVFNAILISNSLRIKCISQVLYYYRSDDVASLSHKSRLDALETFSVMKKELDRCYGYDERVMDFTNNHFISGVFSYIFTLYKDPRVSFIEAYLLTKSWIENKEFQRGLLMTSKERICANEFEWKCLCNQNSLRLSLGYCILVSAINFKNIIKRKHE